jgi:hypothetical protein
MLEGGCLCGGVRFAIDGKLGPAGHCHCSQCRRASGAAFASNAPVRTRYFTLRSGAELVREYESSPGKYRAFCCRCGSPLYSRRESEPALRRIRLGTLDGDPEPAARALLGERQGPVVRNHRLSAAVRGRQRRAGGRGALMRARPRR